MKNCKRTVRFSFQIVRKSRQEPNRTESGREPEGSNEKAGNKTEQPSDNSRAAVSLCGREHTIRGARTP